MSERGIVVGRNRPEKTLRRQLLAARRLLIPWGASHFADYPWRAERNPFHALVAEILLQRTRADQVVPVFRSFKQRFPASRDLGSATQSTILKTTGSLGLHWRARFLRDLGRELSGRPVPRTLEELTTLPGVGPYAAAAYLSFHQQTRAVLLDSNIVRFYGRLLGIRTGPETRRSREFREIAELATPADAHRAYNYALLDFTRAICTPRPRCEICPLAHVCDFGRRRNGGELQDAIEPPPRVRAGETG